jgi:hypothetical protein
MHKVCAWRRIEARKKESLALSNESAGADPRPVAARLFPWSESRLAHGAVITTSSPPQTPAASSKSPYRKCPGGTHSSLGGGTVPAYFANHTKNPQTKLSIRHVEKKTCEFAVQAARIAGFPGTIVVGFAEIGFIFESFMSSSSTLRCSCGWGRLVRFMMQFSHAMGAEEKDSELPPLARSPSVEIMKHSADTGRVGSSPRPLNSLRALSSSVSLGLPAASLGGADFRAASRLTSRLRSSSGRRN